MSLMRFGKGYGACQWMQGVHRKEPYRAPEHSLGLIPAACTPLQELSIQLQRSLGLRARSMGI